MDELTAKAALVPASDLGDGLTTTIPRSEIQDVLAAEEEPIELVLDVTRFSDGEAGEMRNVSVTWERSDLERLLNEAQGDQIELTFDLDTLRRATDPSEVEAHGLRETALILAVAATAAAGGAQAAAAEPGPMLGQTAPITQSTAPAGPEIPYLSHGEGVSAAELGIGTGVAPDDRALPRTGPVATTGGTASDPDTFSVPGPETVVVAGAIALAITGAFFLVGAGRRRVRPI
jgi:hypothetical protein